MQIVQAYFYIFFGLMLYGQGETHQIEENEYLAELRLKLKDLKDAPKKKRFLQQQVVLNHLESYKEKMKKLKFFNLKNGCNILHFSIQLDCTLYLHPILRKKSLMDVLLIQQNNTGETPFDLIYKIKNLQTQGKWINLIGAYQATHENLIQSQLERESL